MNILETITERTKERIREEKKQISINEKSQFRYNKICI